MTDLQIANVLLDAYLLLPKNSFEQIAFSMKKNGGLSKKVIDYLTSWNCHDANRIIDELPV